MEQHLFFFNENSTNLVIVTNDQVKAGKSKAHEILGSNYNIKSVEISSIELQAKLSQLRDKRGENYTGDGISYSIKNGVTTEEREAILNGLEMPYK